MNSMALQKFKEITKRPRLTEGQKVLYRLACNKLEREERIFFKEAKKLYFSYGCREMRDGVPYYYNYYQRNEAGEIVGGFEPMSEYQIVNQVITWLTRNIGSLVLKGYLKIMPAIELKEIE